MVQLQMVSLTPTSNSKRSSANCVYSSTTMDNLLQERSTVCKHALLKKVKTGKYKFFVLHKDSTVAPARLEYYESESHWIKKKKPRRTIQLHTCFSINAFADSTIRGKFGITLYTKDENFKIAFDDEQKRDMWLADMRLLKHSSSETSHSPVQHIWCVRAHPRGMRHPFEGDFELCLNDQQASLMSKDDPEQMIVLPLNVITDCHNNNKFFGLEVNNNAETGPGEIWLELEDALIAQHVHRAFTRNLLLVSTGDDSFRPVSRSLSYKDKKTAYNRIRSGSDARQRGRIGQSISSKLTNSMMVSPSIIPSGYQRRDRSDSIDSHGTSASMSTDESEYCHSWQNSSRSNTPESHPQYMPMNMGKPENDCKCLSSTGSLCGETTMATQSDSYADMTYGCGSKPQDKNSNFVYVDMSGGQVHLLGDSRNNGYIDMTAGQHSPRSKGCKLKPEPVKCYVIDNDKSHHAQSKSEVATNHRPSVSPQPQSDEYVEMCGRRKLTDKSSSAPHLLPTSLYQQPQAPDHPIQSDVFMNLEFDNRNRTSSLSFQQRPRGSSWGQTIRPRSHTTDHKGRPSRMQRVYTNNISNGLKASDYIDMTCGSTGPKNSYVEMSRDIVSKEKLAVVQSTTNEKEDKENYLPHQSSRPHNRVPPLTHPFPELLSASSEDDVSLHSMEGSLSFHSLTGSADSMSTSSHSSHHSTAFTSSLDMEPYVAMHPAPANGFMKSVVHRGLLKPAKVPSYILDDAEDKPEENNRTNYMEMSPSTNKHTKQ